MRLTDSQRRQLGLALLVSMLGHALLLSLAFNDQGLGRPVLGLPWRDLPVETPNLRVVMVPARGITAPASTATAMLAAPTALGAPGARFARFTRSAPAALPALGTIVQPMAGDLNPAPPTAAAPPVQPVTSTVAPDAPPTAVVLPEPTVAPEPSAVTHFTDGVARVSNLRPGTAAMARVDAPEMIAVDRPVQLNGAMSHALPLLPPLPLPLTLPPSLAAFLAPPPLPTVEAAVAAASSPQRALLAPRAALPEALARIDPQAREPALDLTTLDASAQKSQRQIQRLQADWVDAARLDERQATVRQTAAALEAGRAQDAQAAQAAQAAQVAQAAQAAVATQAEADAARREASRRAMGRLLDEEAARRRDAETAAAMLPAIAVASAASAAARQPAALPLSWGADPNAELVLYAQAWARKFELNLTIEMVRDAARQRHASPLVTVAIRQDGSLESVTFLVSSGVAAIDDAIRRIVQSQAPYPAFPPALARDFDVIEIRRTWAFDMAVRLY